MFTASYWDPFANLGSFGLRPGTLRRLADADVQATRARRHAPHYEYAATEQAFVFRFDVPGLAETDFDLEVHDKTLTVRAERKHEAPEGFTAQRVERPSFRLAQSFALPTRVDVERVEAQLHDGVLTITLPKAAEAQPRRIEVKSPTTSTAATSTPAREVQS